MRVEVAPDLGPQQPGPLSLAISRPPLLLRAMLLSMLTCCGRAHQSVLKSLTVGNTFLQDRVTVLCHSAGTMADLVFNRN